MPRKLTIGTYGYHKGVAVATLSFTPLSDRAAVVTRIFVDKPSAADTWVLTTTGQELARFPINPNGHQQMLSGPSSAVPRNYNIFDFAKYILQQPIRYPVARGQTIQIASAGGATANVAFEYEERDATDITSNLQNGTDSQSWLLPIFLNPGTVTHASGVNEDDYAGQVAPSFFPNLFGTVQLPAGWMINILALFFEGAGVNTFSGAANHQSVSDHVALIYNGQRMFTRDALDGIPIVGAGAAAGSANTVFGADETPYPAFQDLSQPEMACLDQPLMLAPGSQLHWLFGTSGDSTGGASYAGVYTAMLAQVNLTGMSPQ